MGVPIAVIATVMMGGCAAAPDVEAITPVPSASPSSGGIVDGTPRPSPSEAPQSQPTNGAASPYIVFAGVDDGGATVSASGAVDGVLEEGGSCTFTFVPESGEPDVSVQSTGHSNSTYTSCGIVQVPIDQFSTGAWEVQLHYQGASVSADGPAVRMDVP